MTNFWLVAYVYCTQSHRRVGGVMTPPYKSIETAIDERPKIGYDMQWSDIL